MKKEEILSLCAGPALDALIARKVMGWEWRDYKWWDGSSKLLLVPPPIPSPLWGRF